MKTVLQSIFTLEFFVFTSIFAVILK